MLGLGAVAGFTGNTGVFTFAFQLEDIDVAGLAGLMARVDDGLRRYLADRVSPVMTELAEAAGHHDGADPKENQPAQKKHRRHAKQVFHVLHATLIAIGAPVCVIRDIVCFQ